MFALVCFTNGCVSWFFSSFYSSYYRIMFTLCHFAPRKTDGSLCWEKKKIKKKNPKPQNSPSTQGSLVPLSHTQGLAGGCRARGGDEHVPLHRYSCGKLSFSSGRVSRSNGTLLWDGGSKLTSKILLRSGFTNRSLKHQQSLFIDGANRSAVKELPVCCRFMKWEWAWFSSR